MDYRDLLKKYMRLILIEEGDAYFDWSVDGDKIFTAEEKNELAIIRNETGEIDDNTMCPKCFCISEGHPEKCDHCGEPLNPDAEEFVCKGCRKVVTEKPRRVSLFSGLDDGPYCYECADQMQRAEDKII